MRIALASDWYLPRLGGIELQVAALGAELRARGHEATVVTGTSGTTDEHVHRLRVARLPFAGVALPASLRTRMREALAALRVDVVHAHVSVVSPVAYAAVLAARDLALPAVVTFHSELHASARLLAFAEHVLAWRRWPVAITAVSGLVARQLATAIPDLAVERLPNGVRRAEWRAPRDTRRDGAAVRFVSALRLHRKKRPLALVKAFARARARRPEIPMRLILHGEGPERRALERAIRHRQLEDCVTLAGWTSRTALAESYASSDCFVLPTRREAFGIAALEARCAGLPVIAMGRSGVTDFLTHGRNALLADDDRELAAHLARVAGDPALRTTLGASADDLAAFDWPTVVERHLACYERTVDAATSPGRVRIAPN